MVALGWLIDIVVGWIVGSIVVALIFALLGLPETAGVVLGTVAGIAFMRWRRMKSDV